MPARMGLTEDVVEVVKVLTKSRLSPDARINGIIHGTK